MKTEIKLLITYSIDLDTFQPSGVEVDIQHEGVLPSNAVMVSAHAAVQAVEKELQS